MRSQEMVVGVQASLLYGRQAGLEFPVCLFRSDRLQGPWFGTSLEDSLYLPRIEGLITTGMDERFEDVLAEVVLFESQDGTCMKPGIPGMLLFETPEKRLGSFAQGDKGFPDRFQAVAQLLVSSVIRILRLMVSSVREPLMPGYSVQFRAVHDDFSFRGLHGEDVHHVFIWYRVGVGLELHEPVQGTDAQSDFGTVVRMRGQGSQGTLLFFEKQFEGRSPRSLVHMPVGNLPHPPPSRGSQMIYVVEFPCVEEIVLHILERSLNLALCPGTPSAASHRLAPVVGNEADESGIENGTVGLPSQYDGLLAIVEALCGNAFKVFERVPVPANQRVEVPVHSEIDILPSGKAENIGVTDHLGLSCSLERDRVRTPIHLALFPGFRLKTDRGFTFWLGPNLPEFLPHNRLATLVAHVPQLLEHPLPGDLWKLLQKLVHLFSKGVKLAFSGHLFARVFFCNLVMPLLPLRFVIAQNTTHRVSTDLKIPGQGTDAPAPGMPDYDKMVELFPASNEKGRQDSFLHGFTECLEAPLNLANTTKQAFPLLTRPGASGFPDDLFLHGPRQAVHLYERFLNGCFYFPQSPGPGWTPL